MCFTLDLHYLNVTLLTKEGNKTIQATRKMRKMHVTVKKSPSSQTCILFLITWMFEQEN